jgi:isocitrate lyase
MTAYVNLQEAEFEAQIHGYTATRHQREVGAGYFDTVTQTITGGRSSLASLKGSTEVQQFGSTVSAHEALKLEGTRSFGTA